MAEWLSLTHAALRAPGPRIVSLRGGLALSHERFHADVARWHATFRAVQGRRIALYFEDSYEFACALFGAWHAGKVPVLPGDAQPVTVQRLLPDVDACAGDLPGALQPVTHASAALAPLDLRETLAIIYTSGSSGRPLALQKRLAQLDAEISNLEAVFGARLGADTLIHATVSHQHIYGLLFVTLWPLAAGRAVAVEKLAYPEQMAGQLAAGPSVLVSSPAHLRRLPDNLEWSGARRELRAIFSSGGPLPPESSQQTHALTGQSPIEVYGSSETGGIAWRQRAHDGDAWTPLPYVRWRLQEDTLCVQSRHLDGDEWWETADRVRALEDGRFLLQGRADRIVKIAEKRVSLVAMEEALVASGLLAETRTLLVGNGADPRLCVVGVPSEAGWQLLHTEGKRALNEALRAHLLRGFERVVLPRRFRYVPELPVNTQGKATEALLSALFESELPQAQWRERSEAQAVLALEIVPQLRVLDGHFPGAPVLPGVAQLDWAIVFGRQAFAGLPPAFIRVEQLKFQLPVLPPLQLELALQWDAPTGRLTFTYRSHKGTHSSGRLVFGDRGV